MELRNVRPSRMRDGPHHLEDVYRSKAPDAVSWYRSHLDTSLGLIEKIAPDQNAAIIDVGGGESTLVDDFTSARIPGPDSARYVRRRSHCDKEAFGFYLRARNMGRIRYYGGRPACASMRRVERPRRLSRNRTRGTIHVRDIQGDGAKSLGEGGGCGQRRRDEHSNQFFMAGTQ